MRITNLVKLVLALVLALLVAFGVVGIAIAAVPTDTTTALRTSSTLRNAVRVDAIMEHERAFQKIANSNGHTRVSGTAGYDASAEYVAGKLRAAGYVVTLQPFTYPFFQEVGESTFKRVSPNSLVYARGNEYDVIDYSGAGEVTGLVVPTNDVQIPPSPTPGSTSGCEATDFAGFPAGSVALIQRGTCTFGEKVKNAEAAGAIAAIIFNEGQEGRTRVIKGRLGAPAKIAAVGTTFDIGAEFYKMATTGQNPTVHIVTQTVSENRNTANVIADTKTGRTDRTLMVGGHLDSVPEGPGINDNGSGTASILEIALQMKKLNIKPTNHVRFAFWGAEESGLFGSQHYVSQLDGAQREDIALYLNFDMIGSPNFVRFVYDGDGSEPGAVPGPDGSGTIEKVFLNYFASKKLATEPTPLGGRSDYQPFIQAGIPAGGLFSGAEGIKTPEQAVIYGGTAGSAFDACYHQECDTITNLNKRSINQLADGAAHATLTFAQTP
jgi:Zn-dependent M28 family amino/carboxypeptidase